ncbi:hypothetical protein ACP275_09G022400 [Erythranthe tilingii]
MSQFKLINHSFDDDYIPLIVEKKKAWESYYIHNWMFNEFTHTIQLSTMLIWGVAGLGKTALVIEFCNNPSVRKAYKCFSFASIGPRCTSKEILRLVLRGMSFPDRRAADGISFNDDDDEDSLADLLYRTLHKSRYLIVLDDIRDTEVWIRLKVSFPDDGNMSRIILTSRREDFLGRDATVQHLEMSLLNDDESWDLLRKLVITAEGEGCSPELEEIGKKIAKNCRGLPLAIIEVAEHLRKIEKTEWKMVAEREDPVTITKDENRPLKQTIQNLVSHSQSKFVLPDSKIKFISDELCSLESSLEKVRSSPSSRKVDVSSSERRVTDVARKLEDLIDSRISNHFLLRSNLQIFGNERFTDELSQQLEQFRQEITAFTQLLQTGEEEDHYQHQEPSDDSFDVEYVPLIIEKKKAWETFKIWDWMFDGKRRLSTMLIWGMAGLGKTALAREYCNNPDVRIDFECFSFVSIGPHYKLREILQLVLRRMSFLDRRADKISFNDDDDEDSLAGLLHRTLHKHRYLIVLDNIWDTDVWLRLKVSFPDDRNMSRIILTSRLRYFVNCDDTVHITEMSFLDDGESWNLLRKLVFTNQEERCSRELEEIGKKIAKNCEGLPLAIIEVGKLLSKTEKTVEDWKILAEKEDPLTITIDDNTPLSEALSLSYTMLPQYLKACFLYMGVFPKKYKIPCLKVSNLWISEGILEPGENNSVEAMADRCLSRLALRSVILYDKLTFTSKRIPKTSRLHFTFRNLCVNEAHREKFFCVIKKYADFSFPEKLNSQNRLCFHNNIVLGFEEVHSWMESIPNARSLLCFGPKQPYPIALYLGFRLLKVLDAVSIRFYEFPLQVVKLVHLKYLAITYDGEIPSSISCLWNLEVLIVSRHNNIKRSNLPVYLPIEIWKLHKLKHLECMGLDLPDPSSADDYSLVLENLLTLSGVTAHSVKVGLLARIPNLKKIGIKIESAHDSVETFSFLGVDQFATLYEEIESFKCVVVYPSLIRSPENVTSVPIHFPLLLKKISLSGCGFSWSYVRAMGDLPNLETLKLRWYAFCGPVWKTSDWDFPSLKYLLLEDLDLKWWDSTRDHFPSLVRLVIRHCYNLQEIPRDFAHIKSLRMVEVDDCRKQVTVEIEKQRKRYRNIKSELRVRFSADAEKAK